jgi:hypothetical protein
MYFLVPQVVKLLYPLYLGSQHSCKRAVKRSVEAALGALASQIEQDCHHYHSVGHVDSMAVDSSLNLLPSGPWNAGAAASPVINNHKKTGLRPLSPTKPATRGAVRRVKAEEGFSLSSQDSPKQQPSPAVPCLAVGAGKQVPISSGAGKQVSVLAGAVPTHKAGVLGGGGIESELLQLEQQQLQRAALVSWARQLAAEVAQKE